MDRIKSLGRKAGIVTGMALTSLFVLAGTALASPPEPSEVVGDATQSIVDQLFAVLVAALPIVAGLIAVTIGFRYALKLVRRAG